VKLLVELLRELTYELD